MASKSHLDQRVAFVAGVPYRDVCRITALFLEGIAAGLQEEGEVWLRGFGTFQVHRVRQPHNTKEGRMDVDKVYVGFKKSPTLKKELEKSHGKVRR